MPNEPQLPESEPLRWRSVKDEPPKDGEEYLVKTAGDPVNTFVADCTEICGRYGFWSIEGERWDESDIGFYIPLSELAKLPPFDKEKT